MNTTNNHYNNFLFKTELTLDYVIIHWQQVAKSNQIASTYAKTLLAALADIPELNGVITDLSVFDKHKELVRELMTPLFPSGMFEEQMIAAIIPYQLQSFFSTPKFDATLTFDGTYSSLFSDKTEEQIYTSRAIKGYVAIFNHFYKDDLDVKGNMVFRIKDEESGVDRHYKLLINGNFCDIKFSGKKLPKLSEADINEIKSNVQDLEVWKKHLPPEHFSFSGFALFQLIDVTEHEALAAIKLNLIDRDSITTEGKFNALQQNLRVLFQNKHLRLGVSAFQKGEKGLINFGKNIHNSFMIQSTQGINCACSVGEIHDAFEKRPEPYFVHDFELIKKEKGQMAIDLLAQDVHSMAIAPLHYDGQFLGLLELASPIPGSFNTADTFKLEEIAPLFAIAVQRSTEDMETRIQAIIKEKYTAIHPSVEWRFVNAALNMIDLEEQGNIAEPEEIVFPEVYPLYGASDIRSSSTVRNAAIQADLIEHLELAKEVLKKACEHQPLPIMEEMVYRLDKFEDSLVKGLFSGDEFTIIDFLHSQVEPLLKDLSANSPVIKNITKQYWNSLDPKLGIIYNKRKDFEESLTSMNEKISTFLDREEEMAQRMFPHYFERYNTDGVEYNIYIGKSMVEQKKFNNFYLHNLRLWQLITTCEIARLSAQMKPNLKVPLDMTHLILLHSNPLSVKFRLDEKQFDVDGAYNIRYEIVKKRIDKALIKGTDERLTQPGKIAIVYSYDKDLKQMEKFIDFLNSKKYVVGETEHVELEDLQGVKGLKALRVQVNLHEALVPFQHESLVEDIKEVLAE